MFHNCSYSCWSCYISKPFYVTHVIYPTFSHLPCIQPRPLRRHLVTSLQPLSSAATAKGATPGGSGWLHTVDGSEIWLTSWGKGSLSNYLQGLLHSRWLAGISSINSWSGTGCEKNKICWEQHREIQKFAQMTNPTLTENGLAKGFDPIKCFDKAYVQVNMAIFNCRLCYLWFTCHDLSSSGWLRTLPTPKGFSKYLVDGCVFLLLYLL